MHLVIHPDFFISFKLLRLKLSVFFFSFFLFCLLLSHSQGFVMVNIIYIFIAVNDLPSLPSLFVQQHKDP